TVNASSDTTQAGVPLTYTITVKNNGPNAASNVTLTNVLPANVTFVSSSASQGTPPTDTSGPVSLGSLDSGATATITIVVNPTGNAVPNITESASVAGQPNDPVASNNSGSVTTTVTPAADVKVQVTGPSNVTVGQSLSYTITVTNSGPNTAT